MKYTLKYGENPHQKGFVNLDETSADALAISRFKTVSGEPIASAIGTMGWVNLKDLDRGLDAITRIASAYDANLGQVPFIAVLIEHGNACGAATGSNDQVINDAIHGNLRASFGAFLVTNVPLTKAVALSVRQWMPANRPFAGIAAPLIDETGAGFFKRKKGVCHLLTNAALGTLSAGCLQSGLVSHTIRGATLTQSPGVYVPRFPKTWDKSLVEDMCLAWGIGSASNSNSITVAKNRMIIANAVGQQERAAACELAVHQVRMARRTAMLKGAAVVSDSFFPFADGFDILARRHVKAIFTTSGSINDKEVMEHAKQFDVIFHAVPDLKGRMFAGH